MSCQHRATWILNPSQQKEGVKVIRMKSQFPFVIAMSMFHDATEQFKLVNEVLNLHNKILVPEDLKDSLDRVCSYLSTYQTPSPSPSPSFESPREISEQPREREPVSRALDGELKQALIAAMIFDRFFSTT